MINELKKAANYAAFEDSSLTTVNYFRGDGQIGKVGYCIAVNTITEPRLLQTRIQSPVEWQLIQMLNIFKRIERQLLRTYPGIGQIFDSL